MSHVAPGTAASADKKAPTDSAAELRIHMNSLYGQFALLSWGAAITAGSRQADSYHGAVSALEDNVAQLSHLYAQLYGDKAGSDFNAVWKKQVSAVLAYALATARKNATAQAAAARQLTEVLPGEVGALLGSLSGGPHSVQDATATDLQLLTGLKAVADGHSQRDFNSEYRALDRAYVATGELAREQTAAAVHKLSDRFSGDVDAPQTMLRLRVDTLLSQQIVTLALANRANMSSNMDEYWALFARSDLLTDDLARVLGSYGGSDMQSSFSAEWKKYTASLQDYEKARENIDHTMQKRVLGDLNNHVNEIAAIFVPAPPSRAVPPPRKGKAPRKPRPVRLTPFQKDVRSFVEANILIIQSQTKGASPFGAVSHAWTQTHQFGGALSAILVSRFGPNPQDHNNTSDAKAR